MLTIDSASVDNPHANPNPSLPPSLPQIPEEMNRCRNSYMEQALVPLKLEELGGGAGGAVEGPMGGAPGYQTYLRDSLDAMLKEAKDKFKGYDSCSTSEHAELAYRKVRQSVLVLSCGGVVFVVPWPSDGF